MLAAPRPCLTLLSAPPRPLTQCLQPIPERYVEVCSDAARDGLAVGLQPAGQSSNLQGQSSSIVVSSEQAADGAWQSGCNQLSGRVVRAPTYKAQGSNQKAEGGRQHVWPGSRSAGGWSELPPKTCKAAGSRQGQMAVD